MPALDGAIARLGRVTVLDRPAAWLSEALSRVTHRPPVSTLLGGTWLGHPVHPALTDVPIGCWTASLVLDVTGRGRLAARSLTGAGVLAAVPTIVSGLADWADTGAEVRRIGAVHGLLNLAATSCFGVSWLVRRRHHGAGVVLSLAGTSVLAAAATLGGHLVYRHGIGVDVNTFDRGPDDWTAPERDPRPVQQDTVVVEADVVRVLATGSDGAWRGIGARCSHRDGPLEDGWFADGCVTCPWHHSRFRLDDGAIVDGPATAPQPRYDVRQRDGRFEIRSRKAQA